MAPWRASSFVQQQQQPPHTAQKPVFSQNPLQHQQRQVLNCPNNYIPMPPQPQFQQNHQQRSVSRRYSAGGASQTPQQTRIIAQPLASFGNFTQPQQSNRRNSKNNYRTAVGNSNPSYNRNTSTSRSSSTYNVNMSNYSGRNSFPRQPQQQQSPPLAVTKSTFNPNPNFRSGMKDVPIWLKGLRLHKYTRMFQEMSYDEMMTVDELALEQRQVTKGARKKILQSLDKLRDRSQLIRQLEKCIDENGDARCLIVELRGMMNTPIHAYVPTSDPKPSNYLIDAIGISAGEVPDENLPGHIARLTMRLHEYLFQNGQPQLHKLELEDEYVLKLLQVYDKILTNDAFTLRQKYCMNECKRMMLRYAQEKKIVVRYMGPLTTSLPACQPRWSQDGKQILDYVPSPEDDPNGSNGSISQHQSLISSCSPQTNQQERNRSAGGSRSAPASPLPKTESNSPHGSVFDSESNQVNPFEEWTTEPQSNPSPPFRPLQSNNHHHPSNVWYNSTTTDSSSSSSTSYPSHTTTPLTMNTTSPQRLMNNRWDGGPVPSPSISDAEKSALMTLFDTNPSLYSYILSYLQQQQLQNTQDQHQQRPHHQRPITNSFTKQSASQSPVGTRAPGAFSQPKSMGNNDSMTDPILNGPLTAAEKLRFITESTDSSEILDVALNLAINRLKLQQKEAASNCPINPPSVWQNNQKQSKQVNQINQLNNWWNVQENAQFPIPQQQPIQSMRQSNRIPMNMMEPRMSNNMDYEQFIQMNHRSNPQSHKDQSSPFYDPWSSPVNELSDLLTSTELISDVHSPNHQQHQQLRGLHQLRASETPNPLGRMLNDTFSMYTNESTNMSTSDQVNTPPVMYHLPKPIQRPSMDDGTTSRERELRAMLGDSLFTSDNPRSIHDDFSPPNHLFNGFRPLACNASGAVH